MPSDAELLEVARTGFGVLALLLSLWALGDSMTDRAECRRRRCDRRDLALIDLHIRQELTRGVIALVVTATGALGAMSPPAQQFPAREAVQWAWVVVAVLLAAKSVDARLTVHRIIEMSRGK